MNELKRLVEQISGGVEWGTNGEGLIHCPYHDDKKPSCSININKETFYCHACGAKGTLRQLLEHCKISGPATVDQEQTPYDYRDADGKLRYQSVRYYKDGVKGFYCRRPDGAGGWVTKGAMKNVAPLPYNLGEIQRAILTGESIFVCEGEKDCDKLAGLWLTATTNHGGVLKWRSAHAKYLTGAKVILCGDSDIPGQKHMQQVGQSLIGLASEIKVLELGYPIEKKQGKDISDWLSNHSEEELEALVAAATVFVPQEVEEEVAPADTSEPVRDYGHAAVLARHFTGRFRWAPHLGSWMEWTGKVWRKQEEERVAKISSDVLRREYASQIADAADKTTLIRLMALVRDTCVFSRITAALSFLKGWDGILTQAEEWDSDGWSFNVLNGVIDLHTGQLGPHDPEKLITLLAPIDYLPDATGPAWQAHLELFLPSESIRRQVQRDLEMSLVGAIVDEILPLWCGKGGNGKSTTTGLFRKVLGDYIREAAPNLLVLTRFENHPTEIAELHQRRIIFSSEIGAGKRLDEQRVKELSGGGQPKRAHFMRQDNFDVLQTFTIFMLVNTHPVITGTDNAIWRRVRLIPWVVQIPEADRLPQDQVINALAAEGSAVLNWLLAGLADWQKDRSWMAPEVVAATAGYRVEQDRLGTFLDDACELGPSFTESVSGLFEFYAGSDDKGFNRVVGWCAEAGEEPLGKRAFSNRLKDRGMITKRSGKGGTWKWVGLRLRVTLGDVTSYSPIELDRVAGEQENTSPNVTLPGNDLKLVDTESLLANELQLRNHLNDETILLGEREKRTGEYRALLDEIGRREKAK